METIRNFDELRRRAETLAANRGPARVALAPADDPTGLSALKQAVDANLAVPVLVGDPESIRAAAAQAGVEAASWDVIPADTPAEAVLKAARLASEGRADMILRGRLRAGDFLQALQRDESGLKGKGRVSHVGLFFPAALGRFVLLSDAFVNVDPDLEAMPEIIANAVAAGRALGLEKPKVALLSGVELVYPSMTVAVGAAALAKMSDRGQIPGAVVDGPLSLDVALYPDVARDKKVSGEVAGRADLLLVNKIEAGHALYKSLVLFGQAETAGMLAGLKVPVAMNSRAESVAARLNAIAWCMLMTVK
ncbi:MAG: phosphate butyryltransferase [Candidatus Zixiibacteriota bacterium]|nr:MAG: phosphate butyryltransferase [candidate division Zixibacteria bacterium]